MTTLANKNMSREIRHSLGHPIDHLQHPSYRQDLYQIAMKMVNENYNTICALGPEGSNSHTLALDIIKLSEEKYQDSLYLGQCALTRSMHDILDILEQTQVPQKRVGILPIINTIGGMVQYSELHSNLDEILKRKMRILGVADFAVRHCLLAKPGITGSDLVGRVVYSHPQALSQCSSYIEKVGLVAKSASSTSAAAVSIARETIDPGAVAIASIVAGGLYNLHIVADDIGNLPSDQNVTVMAVVANSDR